MLFLNISISYVIINSDQMITNLFAKTEFPLANKETLKA